METKPTNDDLSVVPATMKSCIACRFSGFQPALGRKCERLPAKPYPSCMDERTKGECGPDGKFFQTFGSYLTSPERLQNQSDLPIASQPPASPLVSPGLRAAVERVVAQERVPHVSKEPTVRIVQVPSQQMGTAEWIVVVILCSLISFFVGLIIHSAYNVATLSH